MIGLTNIEAINLCVLCVFVVRSSRSLAGLCLRIYFTHQTQESRYNYKSPPQQFEDRSNSYPIFTIKNQALSHVNDYDQPRAEFEEVQGFWFTQALKPEDVTQLLLSNSSESHLTLYSEDKLTSRRISHDF
ncbi:MAG: hypothetical protein ACK4XH_13455 [Microcystis sp.]|uniref:hypothetical protein n=1 Tax=Microcystis sp. TaxID=1127 RepID=UPI00391A3BC4